MLDNLAEKKYPFFKKGCSLPKEYYTDQDIFNLDMKQIFSRHWLYAGPVSQIKNPGDFFTVNFANESVIIIRDDEGDVQAFHNSCCHRGARICNERVVAWQS